jgi:hypothetical protein
LVGYNASCGMGRRSYGNASIIKAMRWTQTRALMGTDLNDFNGRPQTTNLGVSVSNPFGRAICVQNHEHSRSRSVCRQ